MISSNINLLRKKFFYNIPNDEILFILNSSVCCIKNFNPKTNIYEIGEEINSVGIILDGIVDIIHTSINGDETIVNRLTKGDIFANSFAFVTNINNLNSIRSINNSTILFINTCKLMQETNFKFQLRLLENIVKELAESNILLNAKINILSQKTLRDKLLTYFNILSIQKGSKEFTIPFNREQLACFLGSERSSICRELSKLKEDNLININKNIITLIPA